MHPIRRGFAVLILFVAFVPAMNLRAVEAVTVATYNIRRIVDQPHERWTDRRPLVVKCIRAMAPDVIGMQEALYPQIRDIAADLGGYAWVGLGRDGASADEFCPIFYRTRSLELVAFGHFWLSDHPQLMGSITWGPHYPRMCTWVRLRVRRGGGEFVVFNTHFDHEVQEAREKSALLVRERVAALDDAVPVIVLGDFNAPAGDNPAYATLMSDGFLQDAWRAAAKTSTPPRHGTATFNDWGKFPFGEARIDWILVRGWRVARAEIVGFAPGGRYPSDHYPVVARLEFPAPNGGRSGRPGQRGRVAGATAPAGTAMRAGAGPELVKRG